MIHEAIGTGATVEEARAAAERELGAPKDVEIGIEVLELPVKKTLGLFGGSPARVRAFYEEAPQDQAVHYLKSILAHFHVDSEKVTAEKKEDGLSITIECEDHGLIIGRRGETLDALQYLTGLVANRSEEGYCRVVLNVGDYRSKREATLQALACKVARQVAKTGRSAALEPMNPYERRIIHTAVQSVRGVKSHSTGMDADRHVVISAIGSHAPSGDRKPYSGGQRRGGPGGGPVGGRPGGGYNRPPQDNRSAPRRDNPPAQSSKPEEKGGNPKDDKDSAPLYGRIQ